MQNQNSPDCVPLANNWRSPPAPLVCGRRDLACCFNQHRADRVNTESSAVTPLFNERPVRAKLLEHVGRLHAAPICFVAEMGNSAIVKVARSNNASGSDGKLLRFEVVFFPDVLAAAFNPSRCNLRELPLCCPGVPRLVANESSPIAPPEARLAISNMKCMRDIMRLCCKNPSFMC